MAKSRNDDTGEEIADKGEQVPETARKPAELPDANSDLVKMRKGEDTLHVHRSNVEEHKKLGWDHA